MLAFLSWGWPLLALWTSDRALLTRQEPDAAKLYAAAPRALLTPQKVSGPAAGLDGRYLSRVGRMDGWLRKQGFVLSLQMGSGRGYNNGADLSADTTCRRFSAGFEVCQLKTREWCCREEVQALFQLSLAHSSLVRRSRCSGHLTEKDPLTSAFGRPSPLGRGSNSARPFFCQML
ncbi:hypothetical protein MSS93_11650 [Deinococcus radiodurans]|nr:hypothetical protein MSS93_11650 [Deinococcus radiodurans]